VVGGLDLDVIVHAVAIGTDSGVPRIYSSGNDLVITLFPLALGAALLARDRRLRRAGALVAGLAFVAIVLLQIRAIYGSLLLSLIVVTAVCGLRSTGVAAALRARVAVFLVATVVAVAVVVVAAPGAIGGSTFGTVGERAVSGIAEARSDKGTVGYRGELAGSMFARLGESWPVGLGFLHPNERYFTGLPAGAIRNTDVGVMNTLMTMGLIGTVLLYLPVLGALVATVRAATRPRERERAAWLAYGAAVWLSTILLASITLVTLFSQSGLVLTAVVMAVALLATEP
jgi:hypothetical protein